MTVLTKEQIKISVDELQTISNTDLADLCYNTEQAIKAGGGFGWITVPPRAVSYTHLTLPTILRV